MISIIIFWSYPLQDSTIAFRLFQCNRFHNSKFSCYYYITCLAL
uniref:Uncharacterized protein n=1 Tax=Arundo donax TaxID=35708 RepID=A0A0A8XU54_ARUDO